MVRRRRIFFAMFPIVRRRYLTLILTVFFLCLLWVPHHKRRVGGTTSTSLIPRRQIENDNGDYSQTSQQPNMSQINYIKSSKVPSCKRNTFLTCIVHSAPRHFLFRKTIRQTWGSVPIVNGRVIRVVFFVGRSTDKRIRAKVSHEIDSKGDMIQGVFLDTYKNLAYKHLMGYRWILDECSSTDYVLKADDDVFVDMFRAISFLVNTFRQPTPGGFLGCLIVPEGSEARRSGKWAVTNEEYPAPAYKEYCSGMAYFATPDSIARVLMALQLSSPYFLWVDDVFVTGHLASSAGIKRNDLSVWYARHEFALLKWLSSNSSSPCPWMFGELSARNWPDNVLLLWSKTLKSWKKQISPSG